MPPLVVEAYKAGSPRPRCTAANTLCANRSSFFGCLGRRPRFPFKGRVSIHADSDSNKFAEIIFKYIEYYNRTTFEYINKFIII